MSYRVVYGETMPVWEQIFDTHREARLFAKEQKRLGDIIFSVAKVVPGEPPRSLTAVIDMIVNLEFTPQQIAHLIVTAIEGGKTAAWCEAFKPATPDMQAKADACNKERPWYSDPAFWTDDYTVSVAEIIDESEEPTDDNLNWHTVGQESLRIGLGVAAEKVPHHFADLLQGNLDAVSADAILQCIVLGGVVY
jgi:hypothetical protein